MLYKFNALTIAAYLSVTGLAGRLKESGKELLNDERGISGIVVAVLLVMVAILAAIALWGFLDGWLENAWGNITQDADENLRPPR